MIIINVYVIKFMVVHNFFELYVVAASIAETFTVHLTALHCILLENVTIDWLNKKNNRHVTVN